MGRLYGLYGSAVLNHMDYPFNSAAFIPFSLFFPLSVLYVANYTVFLYATTLKYECFSMSNTTLIKVACAMNIRRQH